MGEHTATTLSPATQSSFPGEVQGEWGALASGAACAHDAYDGDGGGDADGCTACGRRGSVAGGSGEEEGGEWPR